MVRHELPQSGQADNRATPNAIVWLFTGWAVPLSISVLAVVIGLGIQYLGGAIGALGVVLDVGQGGSIPWSDLVAAPALVWSGFHGGLFGLPIVATGLLWVWIAFRIAALPFSNHDIARSSPVASPLLRVVVVSIKTALVYAFLTFAIILSTSALVDRFGLSRYFPNLEGVRSSVDVNIGAALAVSLAMGFVFSVIGIARRVGISLLPKGPSHPIASVLRSAGLGTRRVVLIGVIGMAVFLLGADLIDLAVHHQLSDSTEVGAFVLITAAVSWVWGIVDFGLLGLIHAGRFFIGVGEVVESGKPVWVFSALAVVALAFMLGGYRAASLRNPATVADAAATGFLAGILAGPALMLLALFSMGVEGGGVVAAALLVPIGWGLASAVGGSTYGRMRSLPTGIEGRSTDTSIGTRLCRECGASGPEAASFCNACGASLEVDRTA